MTANIAGGRQATIGQEIRLEGIGVHSGAPVSLTLSPAEANTGILFNLPNGARISADFRAVSNVTLCTVLSDADGASVATVEHLLAALRGLEIDNVEIDVDGAEIAIMDGSAEPFVDAIAEAGRQVLAAPRRYIKVLKPVRIEEGGAFAALEPCEQGFHLDVEIDFETPLIGRQRWSGALTPEVFHKELSRARTFGFMKDVERLWAAGRALGSSLENSVALAEDRIINPEGLRYRDEFVRHKTLDAVGDLALAGAPLLGAFRSYRSGHRLNTMILAALYAQRDAWTMVEAATPRPRHREVAHVQMGWGVPSPAFAADRS